MTDAMKKHLSVSRQDIAAIIEDVCLGCYETAIKHLGAMLAAAPAEPVAWQYRLIGPDGPTRWRECNDDVRAMIAASGHYDGVNKSPAELRPLYAAPSLHREAISEAPTSADELEEDDDGDVDLALTLLCGVLGLDPKTVNWDAATETRDGDIEAVISNIIVARFGENWNDPSPEDEILTAQSTALSPALRAHDEYREAQEEILAAACRALEKAHALLSVIAGVVKDGEQRMPIGVHGNSGVARYLTASFVQKCADWCEGEYEPSLHREAIAEGSVSRRVTPNPPEVS